MPCLPAFAQEPPRPAAPSPPQTSQAVPPTGTPGAPPTAQTPSVAPSPSVVGGPKAPSPPDVPQVEVKGNGAFSSAGSEIHLRDGVTVTYGGTTLIADRLDGNLSGELIFSGHARIERPGGLAYADAIHFFARDGHYRLDNPRGTLDPSLLGGRVTVPVYLNGGEIFGMSTGYSIADQIMATTCTEPYHHYELHIANADVVPHKRIVLRRVSVIFFGVKLITLPIVVIPLDQEPPRHPHPSYLPEFGQNYQEGYFARFPYVFSEGSEAATYLRTDFTQLQGMGYRLDQEYLLGKQNSYYNTSGATYAGGGAAAGSTGAFNTAYGYGTIGANLPRLGTGTGPQNGGLFYMTGYYGQGFNRNFNASFQQQQNIGGSNHYDFSTQIQRNNSLLLTGATTSATAQTSKFDFTHNDAAHGVNDALAISLSNSDSTGFDTSQFTASLHQSYAFGSAGSTRNSLGFNLDLSHLLTTSTFNSVESVTRSERLNPMFVLQHMARDYSWILDANESIPIGFQSGASNAGTLEKLPELTVSTSTYNYRGGWLRNIPADFQFGIGEYSEPNTAYTNGNIMTDRVLLGVNVQPITLLKGQTEVITSGGFEQRFYGDGAAAYIIRDSAQLREHLGGRSGFDLNYDYQQPEGATPFLFDSLQHAHTISAQAGYLDDKNFQATLRVGYDFLGSSSLTPWQSLSTNLMWRPNPNTRFDLSGVYDPNQGKFFSFINTARFRGKNDFALDIVTDIDPNQPGIRHKFTQINTQFDIPIGHRWRLTGLLNYSGLTGQFASRNVQVAHDWDCMEATFTYTETIGSVPPDRQFYLAIRIKGLPFSRAFARGPAGGALGTGVGNTF